MGDAAREIGLLLSIVFGGSGIFIALAFCIVERERVWAHITSVGKPLKLLVRTPYSGWGSYKYLSDLSEIDVDHLGYCVFYIYKGKKKIDYFPSLQGLLDSPYRDLVPLDWYCIPVRKRVL